MNRRMRTFLFCTFALALTMLAACSEDRAADPLSPIQSEVAAPQMAVTETPAGTSYTGVIGGLNQYEILVPFDWNGELVLYAHGFVDSYESLRLPDKDNIEQIRDDLVAQGFAFAWCSFRENGLAVKDGAWSTRQVHQIVRSKVKAEPTYTWLMGHSLGGLVAVQLAEKHPYEYDGVLTLAGMIGGTAAQVDYVGDVRILFDLFYGDDVLPGSVCEPAVITNPVDEVVNPVLAAINADQGQGLGAISRILPLPGRNGAELVESLITGIMFYYRGAADLFERTGGACPVDNMAPYTERWPGALPPEVLAWVNAMVPRYERSIPTAELFDRWYEPSGRLGTEMIALHLTHDPIVPIFHEELYAAKVAAMGSGDLLETRPIEGYGHTLEIPLDAIGQAFADLRTKVVPLPTVFTP